MLLVLQCGSEILLCLFSACFYGIDKLSSTIKALLFLSRLRIAYDLSKLHHKITYSISTMMLCIPSIGTFFFPVQKGFRLSLHKIAECFTEGYRHEQLNQEELAEEIGVGEENNRNPITPGTCQYALFTESA
ncbi:hypothetical protein GSS88_00030 [Corynebacterium sp. 3HC-13]|uniref:hypothetical protein n=1 Tax=Corynebacterium poyangense TaxID=2684405 RepID=UPI001CCBE6DC|nr:hypothetical protein [Corynebacterium poyangense]MBZ8176197.1 hypothetical protein [Corynebacterium poyangense]